MRGVQIYRQQTTNFRGYFLGVKYRKYISVFLYGKNTLKTPIFGLLDFGLLDFKVFSKKLIRLIIYYIYFNIYNILNIVLTKNSILSILSYFLSLLIKISLNVQKSKVQKSVFECTVEPTLLCTCIFMGKTENNSKRICIFAPRK